LLQYVLLQYVLLQHVLAFKANTEGKEIVCEDISYVRLVQNSFSGRFV